jgi:hypothetical protein
VRCQICHVRFYVLAKAKWVGRCFIEWIDEQTLLSPSGWMQGLSLVLSVCCILSCFAPLRALAEVGSLGNECGFAVSFGCGLCACSFKMAFTCLAVEVASFDTLLSVCDAAAEVLQGRMRICFIARPRCVCPMALSLFTCTHTTNLMEAREYQLTYAPCGSLSDSRS